MAQTQQKKVEETVERLWSPTLKGDATDPRMTVHQLPEVQPAEVETLTQSLKATVYDENSVSNERAEAIRNQSTMLSNPKAPTPAAKETAPYSKPPSFMHLPAINGDDAGEGVAGQDFFRFTNELGKGGMGVVWCANQGSLGREVAVKTMRDTSDLSRQQVAAFLREALITGKLAHPNIVPVHLFGRDAEGQYFMVMKRVQGRSWAALIAESMKNKPAKLESKEKSRDEREKETAKSDLAEHLEIFQKVCDAIAFAHSHNIVHRDLKPENVMVGDFGEVMVMDWGLALDVSGEDSLGIGISREKASTVAGTPAYMAPEMALGEIDKIGLYTDIYLLGAILHEIITGRPPHIGMTIFEVLQHAALGRLEPIEMREGLPREARDLERVILKALSTDPALRYQDVETMADDIRAFQAGQGDRNESLAMASQARREFDKLRKEVEDLRVTSPYYPKCAEVLAKVQQALTLWGFNPRAMRVRQEVLALYADLALRGRDWGLAESLLRDLRLSGSGGAALANPLENRMRKERDQWRKREVFFQRAYRFAAVMFFVCLSLAGYFYYKWNESQIYREQMEEQRDMATAQRNAVTSTRPDLLTNPQDTPDDDGSTAVGQKDSSDGREQAPEVQGVDPNPPPDQHAPPVHLPPDRVLPSKEKVFASTRTPWFLPREGKGDPSDKPGGHAPLSHLTTAPDGHVLLWDDEGMAWEAAFDQVSAPSRPFVSSMREPIVAAAWAGEKKLVYVNNRGHVRVGDSPDRPWFTVFRTDEQVTALAARQEPGKLMVAVAVGKNIVQVDGRGKTLKEDVLPAPAHALVWSADGALAAVTTNTIHIIPPQGEMVTRNSKLELGEVRADEAGKMLVIRCTNEPGQVLVAQLLGQPNLYQPFMGAPCTAAAINRAGNRMAFADGTGHLVVVEQVSDTAFNEIYRGRALPHGIRDLALNADGTRLMALDAKGGAHAWKINPGK